MPNPKDFDSQDAFVEACVPERIDEGDEQDQAVAVCTSMWKDRSADKPTVELRKKPDEDKTEIERRNFFDAELRVLREKDKPAKIVGYAAVFNSMSEDLWGFREKIAPGAFKNALKGSDVRMLWNHDPNIVLGRTTSGTLTLKEDKNGLYIENTPPDTQLVRDMVLSPIERGDVTQQSFGFTIKKDSWEEPDENSNELPTRTIEEVRELFDVSPVTYPAYPDTTVALRSKQSWEDRKKDEKKEDKDSKIKLFDAEKLLKNLVSLRENVNQLIENISPKEEPTLTEDEKKEKEKREADASETETPDKKSQADAKDDDKRDVFKEIDSKFEKYGERFFK
jgi:HK97 family phage prohead protease